MVWLWVSVVPAWWAQDPFVHTPLLKTVLTFALRFGNTFVGGAQWVELAALVGLQ